MLANHNIDALDTSMATDELGIDMSGEYYPGVEGSGDLQIAIFDWPSNGRKNCSLTILSPQVDTALFGNLPISVGDTYELWYQLMNVESIKTLGKEDTNIYDEQDYTLKSYYYADDVDNSSYAYLEYIYEDANQNRYSFQINSHDHRQLHIDISVYNEIISEIDVDASLWRD